MAFSAANWKSFCSGGSFKNPSEQVGGPPVPRGVERLGLTAHEHHICELVGWPLQNPDDTTVEQRNEHILCLKECVAEYDREQAAKKKKRGPYSKNAVNAAGGDAVRTAIAKHAAQLASPEAGVKFAKRKFNLTVGRTTVIEWVDRLKASKRDGVPYVEQTVSSLITRKALRRHVRASGCVVLRYLPPNYTDHLQPLDAKGGLNFELKRLLKNQYDDLQAEHVMAHVANEGEEVAVPDMNMTITFLRPKLVAEEGFEPSALALHGHPVYLSDEDITSPSYIAEACACGKKH